MLERERKRADKWLLCYDPGVKLRISKLVYKCALKVKHIWKAAQYCWRSVEAIPIQMAGHTPGSPKDPFPSHARFITSRETL